MKRYTLFSILVLAVAMTMAWQGLLPQAGYGRDGGGTHPVLRRGWVDQIDAGTLVIDDMSYRTTKKTRYYGRNGKECGLSAFRVGQFVGFLSEQSLLTDVYLLKPGKEDMRTEVRTPSRAKQPKNTEIILQDGVWRN